MGCRCFFVEHADGGPNSPAAAAFGCSRASAVVRCDGFEARCASDAFGRSKLKTDGKAVPMHESSQTEFCCAEQKSLEELDDLLIDLPTNSSGDSAILSPTKPERELKDLKDAKTKEEVGRLLACVG